MNIFGKIKDAIFGRHAQASEMPAGAAPDAPAPGAAPPPRRVDPDSGHAFGAGGRRGRHGAGGEGERPEARLAPLDRRHDEGAGPRQQPVRPQGLARELDYKDDTNDSATMNVWLHKALMKKLSENGGKVPAELTD